MKKIPVQALFDNCNMMLQNSWGYIWGTSGVLCTQAVVNRSADNPKNPNPDLTRKEGPKWIGHMVLDCSAVPPYIWKQYGLYIPHGSSSMVSQGYIVDCGSVPHPGWAALVDPTPDTPDNTHIGIVSEDGLYVYEAKGTRAGFVKSKLSETKFNKFGRFKDVDYSGEVIKMTVPYLAEVTTSSGNLNIRTGPGTVYDIIGKIPKGAQVKVLAEDLPWVFVDYNGQQGYVSSNYLTPREEIKEDPKEDQVIDEPADAFTRLRCTDGTEIRLLGIWEVV